MIRINLLSGERKVAKPKKFTLSLNQKLAIGCGLILASGAGFIGWRFWALSKESARVDAAITTAQQETSRLRSIIDQVQQFEQRRGLLQQRVSLIEQLRKDQTGPVHILDEISRALPSTVWLTEVKQTEANEVLIEGRCMTVTGLPDFAAALEASGYFKRSVDIVSTQTEVTPTSPAGLVKFVIRAQVQPQAGTRPDRPTS